MRDIKEIEARYEQRQNTRGKINLLKKRYIIISLLLIAVITNPSKEKYKNKIIEMVSISTKVGEYPNAGHSYSEEILLEQVIDSYVSYSNYILFSTIHVNHRGSRKIIGFGGLGYIYIPNQLGDFLKFGN